MKYEPALCKIDFIHEEHYCNALRTAELISESKSLEALEELLKDSPKNDIYKHALYLKTKGNMWWEDSDNFPCCIVAETDAGGLMMTIVHYAQGTFGYDFRSNKHKLEKSNWRRATREEMLLLGNFKN